MQPQVLRKYLPFLFAVAAFLACVLACRPGFSPDGRRIVFSTIDEEAKTTFLRVYDRQTGKTTTLRTLPWPTASNSIYCAASWSPSGAQIGSVVVTPSVSETIEIHDVQTGRLIRSVPLTKDVEGIVLTPPVFAKDFLLFGGDKLTRLNLRNGRLDYENVGTNDGKEEIYLLNNQKGIHYYAPSGKGGDSSKAGRIEFGTIDADRLVRIPQQTITTESGSLPDISPDGKRIAVWKHDSDSAIEIWAQSKLEKTIPIPETNSLTLGNLVWSKDQKVIFAPVFQAPSKPASETKSMIYLLEVPIDGSPLRQLELGSSKIKPEEAGTAFQLALAPDGKALALGTPMGSLNKASQPTAFYLIELDGTQRMVKSIAFQSGAKK